MSRPLLDVLTGFLSSLQTYHFALAFLLYWTLLVFYRLTFHPLARFPGPKLAAATRLYEFYYDSICHGRFWKEIERMHERYGPIVRINPFEIHVNDPEFVKVILNTNKDLDKDPLRIRSIGQAQNIQETVEWDVHKRRRAPFDGFFSRRRIMNLSDLINTQVDKLTTSVQRDVYNGGVSCLSTYYRFVTAETVLDYCFGKQFGLFEDQERATRLVVDVSRPGDFPGGHHLGRFTNYVNVIIWAQEALYKIKRHFYGGAAAGESFVELYDYGRQRLREVFDPKSGQAHETVFHRLASSTLSKEERDAKYMINNIFLFLRAGYETTAFNLTLATYFVLKHPDIKARIEREIRTAECYRDTSLPIWNDLEQLPLLHAVIKESLRLGSGVLSRLSRQNPHSPILYQDWIIPPTYPVSVSPPLIHANPTLFPNPDRFDPDRWLRPGANELDKYLIPFSKGSRSCIGMNLAMAELHMFLAAMFRRFDMELVNTASADVVSYYDDFTPSPRNGKQKLWIKATKL